MITLHKHIGFAGVDEKERSSAQRLGKIFQACSIFILYALALQWEMYRKGTLPLELDIILNAVITYFFVIQFALLGFFVRDKWLYVRRNWMIFILILGGFILLWGYKPLSDSFELIRPLLVLYLLIPFLNITYRSLSDNRLGTTLVTAILVMILAGIIVAGIDPAIPTPWEGIWWAWVTMSTVGYGDVVPVSGIGRLFGALLILMGLALFSVITANFSRIFIQREVKESVREVKKESREIRLILKNIQALRAEERYLGDLIEELNDRIDDLEGKIGEGKDKDL